jgi:hypothetical protein
MRKPLILRVLFLCALAGALILILVWVPSANGQKTRQPAAAGDFYPADPKELSKMLDELLSRAAVPEIKEPIVALISPHAGYVFSGGVAAHAYALLKGRKISRVVVISPSHYEGFGFSAVYDGDAYATPLGNIPVDKAFVAKLATLSPLIRLSSRGHAPTQERGEHALEVQLPFLQRVLGDFKLVPVVMGAQDYETSRALGVALAKLIQGTDTLIVASSDLSHFHNYDEAVNLDRKTLKAIEEWDYLSMSRNFESRVWEACGGGPIVAAMIAAERLGANQAKVLRYANSGDITGERSRVIGYGAVALLQSASRRSTAPQFALSGREREELLKIARRSVETAVKEKRVYEISAPAFESLVQERGAFVTLKKKGELRGCIGYIAPVEPLYLTVRDVAAFAALRDTRFPQVRPAELGELEYEISVLTPFQRVFDVKQIRVGQHGLLIKRGVYEGVLLPQVPVEQGWDTKTFLEQACLKAGLPPRAWQEEETDIFLFSALVFSAQKAPESTPPAAPRLQKPPGPPKQQGQYSPRP